MEELLRIGISACLLGQEVRYDGTHKRNRFLTDLVGDFAEWIPFCPEAQAGLGIPRPSMHLRLVDGEVHMVVSKDGSDVTDSVSEASKSIAGKLISSGLDGIVLKAKSPSCGIHGIPYFDDKKQRKESGAGVFGKMIQEQFPLLPIEDEGRLNDAGIRENFVERIFVQRSWRLMVESGVTSHSLMTFHRDHKYLFMSHNQQGYRELGSITGNLSKENLVQSTESYYQKMASIMAKPASVSNHINTLQHIFGYFKKQLSSVEKSEFIEELERYRLRQIPLIVPITLLNHYVRRFDEPYLTTQVYLNPHPHELMLRNHC